MGWNDLDKRTGGGGLSGRFVAFEDKVPVRIRVLDSEPHTTRVHKISQQVSKGGKSDEIFRSIPATDSPDDSFILKHNGKRYPEQAVYSMRVWEYVRSNEGKYQAEDGNLKILQGGIAIFKALRGLYEEHGHLNQFDILITRTGKGRDTEYAVSAAPFPLRPELNVAEASAKLDAEEALYWENVFPKVTAADQEKMVRDAGFDIAYDPAAQLAASMSWDDARSTKFTFGKYKDKTIGEMVVVDAGYVSWAAENVNTNDQVAAACRVAVNQMSTLDAKEAPKKIEAKTPSTPAAPSNSANREALSGKISNIFENNPRFEDMAAIVEVVKKHGGGKTRLKDLTESQLSSLLGELQG